MVSCPQSHDWAIFDPILFGPVTALQGSSIARRQLQYDSVRAQTFIWLLFECAQLRAIFPFTLLCAERGVALHQLLHVLFARVSSVRSEIFFRAVPSQRVSVRTQTFNSAHPRFMAEVIRCALQHLMQLFYVAQTQSYCAISLYMFIQSRVVYYLSPPLHCLRILQTTAEQRSLFLLPKQSGVEGSRPTIIRNCYHTPKIVNGDRKNKMNFSDVCDFFVLKSVYFIKYPDKLWITFKFI